MPLEEVLAFSPARVHRCFLALDYYWRGLVFHHSFIRGNLPFLLGQKQPQTGEGRDSLLLFAHECRAASFSNPRPSSHSCFSQWQLDLAQESSHSYVPFCTGHSQQYASTLGKLWISNLLTVPSTLGTEVLTCLSELPLM